MPSTALRSRSWNGRRPFAQRCPCPACGCRSSIEGETSGWYASSAPTRRHSISFGYWLPTLAIDTATASPSLALTEGPEPLAELRLVARPGSGRRVLQAVHALLLSAGCQPQHLSSVVVGVGPGGFTGLRIGIATALGLGQALGVPVVGCSSLEALALDLAQVADPGAVLAPALDARRREVFIAAYRAHGGGRLTELMAPRALPYDDVPVALSSVATPSTPAVVGGDGVAVAGSALSVPHLVLVPASSPVGAVRAAALAVRVEAGGGRPAEPEYARLPDAELHRRRAVPGP